MSPSPPNPHPPLGPTLGLSHIYRNTLASTPQHIYYSCKEAPLDHPPSLGFIAAIWCNLGKMVLGRMLMKVLRADLGSWRFGDSIQSTVGKERWHRLLVGVCWLLCLCSLPSEESRGMRKARLRLEWLWVGIPLSWV